MNFLVLVCFVIFLVDQTTKTNFVLVQGYNYISKMKSTIVKTNTKLRKSTILYNNLNPDDDKECCEGMNSICQGKSPSLSFIVDLQHQLVTKDELIDENIIQIIKLETSDEQANSLVWKCLGYRYNSLTNTFNNELVFPKWKAKYPNPPDVIGITRNYDPSVDKDVRNASMDLMRSIPRDFKGGVKNLSHLGFKGFSLKELTPNKTRRAQVVNWLIYYREKLFGKTFEDLQKERELEKSKPINPEISELPSEVMFQKLRLDEAVK